MHPTVSTAITAVAAAIDAVGMDAFLRAVTGSDVSVRIKERFKSIYADTFQNVHEAGVAVGRSDALCDIADKAQNIAEKYEAQGEIELAGAFRQFRGHVMTKATAEAENVVDLVVKAMGQIKTDAERARKK